MKLYKLTNKKGKTKNGFVWGKGVLNQKPPIENPELCSGDVFHAYKSANLALLLNPIHADIQPKDLQLWAADGEICADDWGKIGCFDLTLKEKMPLPEWFLNPLQKRRVLICFAILCLEQILPVFEKYLNYDRPRLLINAAKNYLQSAENGAKSNEVKSIENVILAASSLWNSARAWDALVRWAPARAWDASAKWSAENALECAEWGAARDVEINFPAVADAAVKEITTSR